MTTTTHKTETSIAPSTRSVGTPRARALARTAIGAAVAAVLAIVVAGLLDPGYSPVSEGISPLASHESQVAPVMIGAFMAMAVALLSAGAALLNLLPGKRAAAAAILVLLAGSATVVVGFARLDCSTLQQECMARESAGTVSTGHVVHNLVSLGLFLLLAIATFLWGAGLRRVGEARLARLTLLAAVLIVVFLFWFMSGAYGSAGGLVQRVFISLVYGWPVLLAGLLVRKRSGR